MNTNSNDLLDIKSSPGVKGSCMAEPKFLTPYPIDEAVTKIWKSYPIRISGHSISGCCAKPTILVQSMQGGFVSRNCSMCGNSTTLPEAVFLEKLELYVACPKCKSRMVAEVLFNKKGNHRVRLSNLANLDNFVSLLSLGTAWRVVQGFWLPEFYIT